jgi:plastocyanin
VVPTASPSATASPGVTPSPSVSPGAGATPAAAVTPAGVTVQIPANAAGQGAAAFGQNPLVVPVGTTVTWVNNDSVPHTATSDTGVWDSGTLAPGQSFSFTFNTPGTFSYFCMIHGRQSMSGVIQVQ